MLKWNAHLKEQNVRFSLEWNKSESFLITQPVGFTVLFSNQQNKTVKPTGWCIIFMTIYKIKVGSKLDFLFENDIQPNTYFFVNLLGEKRAHSQVKFHCTYSSTYTHIYIYKPKQKHN